MEGYEVVTVDDDKIGKVVGETGNFLIIEQGALLKSKHALPLEFAHVDESQQKVRVTVPKEIVSDSPKIDDENFDESLTAEHYGLAPSDGPGTEGYGVTDAEAGDPSRSSAEQAARQNMEPAEEERARIQQENTRSGLVADRLAGDEREQN